MNAPTQPPQNRENPLTSIVVNIVLPVVILQQLTKRLGEDGPLLALILAVALPVSYGLWDFLRNHHKNYVSLFGLLSVLFTGGFALMKLEGIWFAVKEAAFPAAMAIGVAASSFSRRPLVQTLFCNNQLLRMDLVDARLSDENTARRFHLLTQNATRWLAVSFVISSFLNFIIAIRVFTPLGPDQNPLAQSDELNQQIARMTGLGFVAIALPMMVFTGAILYFFLRRLSDLTKIEMNQLIRG